MRVLRALRAGLLTGLLGAGLAAGLAMTSARDARADDVEKRPKPDYDGREPEKRPGRFLLWIPRILVSPFYLTSEFVLRRPLGALTVAAEKGDWPGAVANFITFDKEHKSGIVPTALYEFAFRPSVGLYFFYDDFLARRNALRVHVATGGKSWLMVTATNRYTLSDGVSTVAVRGAWTRRSDYLFAGFGPRSLESARSRYSADTAEGHLKYVGRLPRLGELVAVLGVRDVNFNAGGVGCCNDPTLAERRAAGEGPPLPRGFDAGYTAVFQHLSLALDSRKPAPAPGSGVRLLVHGEHGSDVAARGGASWMKYGGTLGGFVDVNGRQRVVSLALTLLFVDPLRGQVPFTEQAILGGTGAMRGYRPGRLVDRSAAVVTLQYEWPIWVFLNGYAHVAAGNVFGERLAGIDPKLLRLSTAIGLRASGARDNAFEFLFGLGSETFADGARFTSVRILVGATQGF